MQDATCQSRGLVEGVMGLRLRVRSGTYLRRVELKSQRLGSQKHFHNWITTAHFIDDKPHNKFSRKELNNLIHNTIRQTLYSYFLSLFLFFVCLFCFFISFFVVFFPEGSKIVHVNSKWTRKYFWIITPPKQATGKVPKKSYFPKTNPTQKMCCSTRPWQGYKKWINRLSVLSVGCNNKNQDKAQRVSKW